MSNLMNRALNTDPSSVPQLRTRSLWTKDAGGSAVMIDVTERLAPHGHWESAGADPRASNAADVEAARLASTWAARPEHGYPMWYRGPQPGDPDVWGEGDYDGPAWVDTYAEGEKWIPIPRPGELERLAALLAEDAGNAASSRQIEYCTESGCTSDRCGDRAYEDAARDEYAFCLDRGLEFTRRRACPTPT